MILPIIHSLDWSIETSICLQDASWILPASSPLKCTCPADIYLLLKSSDFVSHDLSKDSIFQGCEFLSPASSPHYELELVLRKWYSVDRSRELRCFVRQDVLLGIISLSLTPIQAISDPIPGISQRDSNYYDFLNEPATRGQIVTAVERFWQTNIKGNWESSGDCELFTVIFWPTSPYLTLMIRYIRHPPYTGPIPSAHNRFQPLLAPHRPAPFHIRRPFHLAHSRPIISSTIERGRLANSSRGDSKCSYEPAQHDPIRGSHSE
jgi:hypothetical protein